MARVHPSLIFDLFATLAPSAAGPRYRLLLYLDVSQAMRYECDFIHRKATDLRATVDDYME